MESKQRHGCVTAWLIIMIIANSFTAIAYLLASEFIIENSPTPLSENMIMLLGVLGTGNLLFSIALLKWKRWAFWGFTATSIIAFGLNITNGIGVGSSIIGLAGIGILYAVLQIKKDGVSSWSNLE